MSVRLNETRLLTTLRQLVEIESVNPILVPNGSGEGRIAHYIGERLDALGLEVRYQNIGDDRYNVIGIMGSTNRGRCLMLNGHTDTVGVTGMEISPLSATFDDGRVYGRGTFDMKGGLASMMMVAETLVEMRDQLSGTLILAFVADEEYASLGTEQLVREYTADAAIVTEPTGLDIVVAHRGFAWATVEIFGRAAHGSRYDMGVDAIVQAGQFLNAIQEMEQRFAFSKSHPLLGRPSVHASLIQGGTDLSTYPSRCKIDIERRTLPSESQQTVENELHDIIRRLSLRDRRFQAESRVFFYRPALETSEHTDIVYTLSMAYQRVIGGRPRIAGVGWWTDAALLNRAGISTVLFGPSGDGAHSPIEYVDFDSLSLMTRVLIQTVLSFCC